MGGPLDGRESIESERERGKRGNSGRWSERRHVANFNHRAPVGSLDGKNVTTLRGNQ
jgi:hypothetical protein